MYAPYIYFYHMDHGKAWSRHKMTSPNSELEVMVTDANNLFAYVPLIITDTMTRIHGHAGGGYIWCLGWLASFWSLLRHLADPDQLWTFQPHSVPQRRSRFPIGAAEPYGALGNNYSIYGGTKWDWLARLRTWVAVLQIWSLNNLCSFRKRDNYICVWPVHVRPHCSV